MTQTSARIWTLVAAASFATALAAAPASAQGPGARSASVTRATASGAAPLTISRGNRVYTSDGYYRTGGYYYRNGAYYDNPGFVPGLLAAPFVMTGALLGGLFGFGYDDYYAPAYYPYGYYPPYGVTYVRTAYSGDLGNFCATPQKVCLLSQPAEVGFGCSCRAPAGLPRFRGMVVH